MRSGASKAGLCPLGGFFALCGFCLEKRRILGAVDDGWLVGGSSRMLLRLSGQGRLVAGVKIVAGA